jgi:hypothetical protein
MTRRRRGPVSARSHGVVTAASAIVIGPSLLTFSWALQSTWARGGSILAVAMFVALTSRVSPVGAGVAGAQVWVRLA